MYTLTYEGHKYIDEDVVMTAEEAVEAFECAFGEKYDIDTLVKYEYVQKF